MQRISISEFKAKCFALLEQASKTQEPIRVTRFGIPIADVIPPTSIQERAAWIGSMKNSMEIVGVSLLRPTRRESGRRFAIKGCCAARN